MKTIKANHQGVDFDLTIDGYIYGNRMNVSIDDIIVENDDLTEKALDKLANEVMGQIEEEKGEIYSRLMEEAKDYGYDEICFRGKY